MIAIGGRLQPVLLDDELRGPSLLLPEGVIGAIEELLPTYGDDERHEGVVYLGGVRAGAVSIVLSAIAPDAETTRGSFVTGVDTNTDLVCALADHGLVLVGQVHSHPGAWVDHSDGDDTGALVKFENYWSVVVPEYAEEGMLPLDRCGFHCFRRGRFARLTPEALSARVTAVPDFIDLRGINGRD